MALGILALLAGMFSVSMGRILFFPVHMLLSIFQVCCKLTEHLPGNMWVTGAPAQIQIIMYGILLLSFCLMKKYMTKPWAMLIFLGVLWIVKCPFLPGDTVTMLDVGQGDGIVIRSADGTAFLVDGGSTSEKELARYTLLPYLKSQGIRELEYVFLTHMDADHINGVEKLMSEGRKEHIRIGTLVLPSLVEQDEDYRRVVAEAAEAGVRICVMNYGDTLEAGGFVFCCLHPRGETAYSDRNDASLVLYVKKGKFSGLLMGDLDGDAETAFAENYPSSLGNVTMLKAGHHGSKASCGEGFLSKCSPVIALISCGENNRYGHPGKETLDRLSASGSRIYVTSDLGAVQIWIGRDKVRVKSVAASKNE